MDLSVVLAFGYEVYRPLNWGAAKYTIILR